MFVACSIDAARMFDAASDTSKCNQNGVGDIKMSLKRHRI